MSNIEEIANKFVELRKLMDESEFNFCSLSWLQITDTEEVDIKGWAQTYPQCTDAPNHLETDVNGMKLVMIAERKDFMDQL